MKKKQMIELELRSLRDVLVQSRPPEQIGRITALQSGGLVLLVQEEEGRSVFLKVLLPCLCAAWSDSRYSPFRSSVSTRPLYLAVVFGVMVLPGGVFRIWILLGDASFVFPYSAIP